MVPRTLILAGIACTWLMADLSLAQTAGQLRRDRLRGTLDVQNARIGEQRVQRQTEVLRLEEMLRSVEDRMIRLERQILSNSQLPAITIAEAEAAVEFADVQFQASRQLYEKGDLSEVTLARHRLDLVRAEGQLNAAKVAHADRLIALELDVMYAERALADQSQQHQQLERLVAKGYGSTEGLKWRSYDVTIAEKQLEQARLRLAAQRNAADDKNPATLLDVEATATEKSSSVSELPVNSEP